MAVASVQSVESYQAASSSRKIGFDPQVAIHTDELIKDLVARINSLQWNFTVRCNARESFRKVDAQKLQKWVQTPELHFGQLTQEHSFFVPQEVNEAFLKMHDLAQKVFKDEKCTFQLKGIATKLNEYAEKIEVEDKRSVPRRLFERIKQICREFHLPEKDEEQQKFYTVFSRLFSIPKNQTLTDKEIDDTFGKMFAFLKSQPHLSFKSFSERIGSLWDFQEERASSDLCTDLSDLLFRHQPYAKPFSEILLEATQTGNTEQFIGKSLVYQGKTAPISLKVSRVEVDKSVCEISFFSENGESARVKVDHHTKQLMFLHHRCLVDGEFQTLITKESSGHIQVKKKIDAQEVYNPFERDLDYTMDVFPKKISRPSPHEPKTFIFSPKDNTKPRVVFTVQSDGEFTVKKSDQDAATKQSIKWSNYIDLLLVLTWKLSYLSSPANLDEKLLSLEEESPKEEDNALNLSITEMGWAMNQVPSNGSLDKALPCLSSYAMGMIVPNHVLEFPYLNQCWYDVQNQIFGLAERMDVLQSDKAHVGLKKNQHELFSLSTQLAQLEEQAKKIKQKIKNLQREKDAIGIRETLPINFFQSRILYFKKGIASETFHCVILKDTQSAHKELEVFSRHLTKMCYMPEVIGLINDISQIILDTLNREKQKIYLVGSFITLNRVKVIDPIIIDSRVELSPTLRDVNRAKRHSVICEAVLGAVFIGFATIQSIQKMSHHPSQAMRREASLVRNLAMRLEIFSYVSQGAIVSNKKKNLWGTYEAWKQKLEEDPQSGFPIGYKVRNLTEILAENGLMQAV